MSRLAVQKGRSEMEPDFVKYHQSLNKEFEVVKDRVRNLIGGSHWESDGEHKEAVLRGILHNILPETISVRRGFICTDQANSKQIDILLTDKEAPTLFRTGDFAIVTRASVRGIIEVKTRLHGKNDLTRILDTLASNIESCFTDPFRFVFESSVPVDLLRLNRGQFWAGLFVYEDTERITDSDVLKSLFEVMSKSHKRIIDCIALGPNRFFRFWYYSNDEVYGRVPGPAWHGYELENLAQAYFVSNLAERMNKGNYNLDNYAWFPIPGGKEMHRTWYISCDEGIPKRFDD